MDAYAETDRLLREEFHCAAKRYDSDEVAALEPALKTGLAGGWHYEEDAHLRPDRLLSSLRRLLVGRGVQIIEGCEAVGLQQVVVKALEPAALRLEHLRRTHSSLPAARGPHVWNGSLGARFRSSRERGTA